MGRADGRLVIADDIDVTLGTWTMVLGRDSDGEESSSAEP